MTDPIKLTLKKQNLYGYSCYMAECPECSEEIEDELGIIECEGCGVMLDCGYEIQLPDSDGNYEGRIK
jgi:hypothetical protein